MSSAEPSSPAQRPQLVRGLGVWQATALNITNMIGIGPFITIPAFLSTMGGPQAMIGWVVAAVLVLCDGLVWSELGAALPGSGGSYHFLREIFGRGFFGRLIAFLFIWQFLVTGALEMASGYVGAAGFVKSFLSNPAALAGWRTNCLAAVGALVMTVILCRHIRSLGWLSMALCAGTLVAVSVVIVSGLKNFNSVLLTFPPDAFHVDRAFAAGLGASMTIAIYDYLGYYNVCHLGEEVHDPGTVIPRSVIWSIAIVATIYLTMNISIIAVVPWQEAMKSTNVADLFMTRLYGSHVALLFTGLILWAAIAGLFALLLGYSRIPYAAARNGDFFHVFTYLHPKGLYPLVSLLALGLLTAACCFFELKDLINATVTVRIVVPFISQIVALHVLRKSRPETAMPFRMWLYPLPSVVALLGWVFVLATSDMTSLRITVGVLVSGCVAFLSWQWFTERAGKG